MRTPIDNDSTLITSNEVLLLVTPCVFSEGFRVAAYVVYRDSNGENPQRWQEVKLDWNEIQVLAEDIVANETVRAIKYIRGQTGCGLYAAERLFELLKTELAIEAKTSVVVQSIKIRPEGSSLGDLLRRKMQEAGQKDFYTRCDTAS